MLSPYAEKKLIRKQVEQVAKIINPTGDKFSTEKSDHPLCEERDKLLKLYWEYMRYENWFTSKNRTTMA